MPKIVDHDARRSLIIYALWRVVARDGASAVSVRSVASEAGVSRSGGGQEKRPGEKRRSAFGGVDKVWRRGD